MLGKSESKIVLEVLEALLDKSRRELKEG